MSNKNVMFTEEVLIRMGYSPGPRMNRALQALRGFDPDKTSSEKVASVFDAHGYD